MLDDVFPPFRVMRVRLRRT